MADALFKTAGSTLAARGGALPVTAVALTA